MVATIQKSVRAKGRRSRTRPMADINVTPFVDVMLVLLIIFMVTAPLLTVGVDIDLPKTKAGPLKGQDEPLAVSIDAQGQIYIQDTEVDMDTLAPRLTAITKANPEVRIFIRGDKAIDYGRVMEVMGAINGAGFKNVALITERRTAPGDKKTSRAGKR